MFKVRDIQTKKEYKVYAVSDKDDDKKYIPQDLWFLIWDDDWMWINAVDTEPID
ncbi:MAG: hypothetical protein LLF98_02475 [Clostridium sp.]|uniref:hypothetical protein n=1 Tax=Clostridium sp. TaxID=1506 RepID=UPI0025C596F6|nr:hypothetical protein [Clostridium sp.]MCE5220148.1 hypothetical protein [Clostridium sp.]